MHGYLIGKVPSILHVTEEFFFTSEKHDNYTLWSCQKVCEALISLPDNIYIKCGTKLFRQTDGIPMGTNCAPLVADLFLCCYERDFMMSLSAKRQSEIIEAFSSMSRHLDDLLNIDDKYFDGLISQIYPSERQSNKANSSETLDLHLSILDGLIACKKKKNLDGDVSRRASYSVYISQFIRFAWVSSRF